MPKASREPLPPCPGPGAPSAFHTLSPPTCAPFTQLCFPMSSVHSWTHNSPGPVQSGKCGGSASRIRKLASFLLLWSLVTVYFICYLMSWSLRTGILVDLPGARPHAQPRQPGTDTLTSKGPGQQGESPSTSPGGPKRMAVPGRLPTDSEMMLLSTAGQRCQRVTPKLRGVFWSRSLESTSPLRLCAPPSSLVSPLLLSTVSTTGRPIPG